MTCLSCSNAVQTKTLQNTIPTMSNFNVKQKQKKQGIKVEFFSDRHFADIAEAEMFM